MLYNIGDNNNSKINNEILTTSNNINNINKINNKIKNNNLKISIPTKSLINNDRNNFTKPGSLRFRNSTRDFLNEKNTSFV